MYKIDKLSLKIILLFVSTIFFSFIYHYLGTNHIEYDTPNTYANTLYFSSMTQTLLGDSKMKPITDFAKLIVVIQAFSTFILFT